MVIQVKLKKLLLNVNGKDNGEKFKDVHGLKAALMKQERQVAASLLEGLLCYALGRDVSFTDRPIIEKALN